MSDIYESIYKGEFFDSEKAKYEEPKPLAPETQTGFLQKQLEKLQEEFQRRSIAQDSEISYLRLQLESLVSRITELKEQFDKHENSHQISQEIIDLRNIPKEQLKQEMVALLADGKTRYADEIANELKVDIVEVVEVFEELRAEGKLFIDGNKL